MRRLPPLYAGLGACSTATATLFAILLTPQGTSGGPDMVLPGVVLTVGLGLAPALASLRDARALLRLEYLLALALVYWLLLDLVQGDAELEPVSDAAIAGALFAIGLFGTGTYAAAFLGRWRLPRVLTDSAVDEVEPRVLLALTVLCFVLGVFKFAWAVGFDPFAMVYYAGASRWSAPWTSSRLGGWGALIDHLPYFGYLVPVLAVTLALRIGWLRPASVMALAMAVLLLILLAQGGGRRVIGVMAGAPLVAWTLAQPRLSPRRVLVIGLACAAILYFMEVMLDYRNRGLAEFFRGGPVAVQFERLNVDDNFLRLAQYVEIIPEQHDFVYHQPIWYTLVRPVPRVLWPDKPLDSGFDLARFIGERGVSLSASVIAEWYASGGFVVVFLGGLLYGQIARAGAVLWVVTDRSTGRLLYGVVAMAVFAGVRSMIDLMLMSYMVLGWIAAWWLLVGRRRQPPRVGARTATRA